MRLDRHFIDLTERRGIPRRRLAALIRLIEETTRYCEEHQEAEWLLEKTHSSNVMRLSSSMGLRYEIPVTKDISFRQDEHGTVRNLNGVTLEGCHVLVHLEEHAIPASLGIACVGKPLRTIVDHPALPGDRIVKAIEQIDTGTAIVLEADLVETVSELPARQYEVVLETLRLALAEKRDCLAAGANVGPSFGSISMLAVTIFCAMTILYRTVHEPTIGWTVLFGILAVVSACAAAFMWTRPDRYLEKRVDKYRQDMLASDRKALLGEIAVT